MRTQWISEEERTDAVSPPSASKHLWTYCLQPILLPLSKCKVSWWLVSRHPAKRSPHSASDTAWKAKHHWLLLALIQTAVPRWEIWDLHNSTPQHTWQGHTLHGLPEKFVKTILLMITGFSIFSTCASIFGIHCSTNRVIIIFRTYEGIYNTFSIHQYSVSVLSMHSVHSSWLRDCVSKVKYQSQNHAV